MIILFGKSLKKKSNKLFQFAFDLKISLIFSLNIIYICQSYILKKKKTPLSESFVTLFILFFLGSWMVVRFVSVLLNLSPNSSGDDHLPAEVLLPTILFHLPKSIGNECSRRTNRTLQNSLHNWVPAMQLLIRLRWGHQHHLTICHRLAK